LFCSRAAFLKLKICEAIIKLARAFSTQFFAPFCSAESGNGNKNVVDKILLVKNTSNGEKGKQNPLKKSGFCFYLLSFII
jgi:hypothetical protein